MAQSMWVKAVMEREHPDVKVELVPIKTLGDKILDVPLSRVGGKGLFVKEIEDALLKGDIDIAVHSMKDVPALLPEGLVLGAFPEREDPRDAIISRDNLTLEELSPGARVGTSSLRRVAQILAIRRDLSVVSLRGNVDTRLRKVAEGGLDAVVLACAGLKRLGYQDRISRPFDTGLFIPAVGQGALGIELREDDGRTRALMAFLNHRPTELTVRAERAFLKELEGGCQVPLACHALIEGGVLRIVGMVAELDGSKVVKEEICLDAAYPEAAGAELAARLRSRGAWEILSRIYSQGGN
jgi:hydroxymethylbilane synthase